MDYSVISFGSGYLSPRYKGRIDLPQYGSGCQTLENWLPQPQGSLTKAPGTYYVAAAKTAAHATRLFSYKYSPSESYIFEMGNLYLRYYRSTGVIGAPTEVVTPFKIAEVWDVQIAASKNEIRFTHPTYAPRKLLRSAENTFSISTPTITAYEWDTNPGGAGNYPSAVCFFQDRLFYGKDYTLWGSRTGSYDDFTSRSAVSIKSTDAADTNTEGYLEDSTADFITDAVAVGDLVHNATDDIWAKVEAVTSKIKLELDRDAFPDGDGSETYIIYTTQINPTDGFEVTWSEDGASIKWLSGQNALVLGTEAGPFTIVTDTNLLTPDSTFNRTRASAFACDDVPAIVANENIFFPERGGKKLRQMIYSDEQKTYLTPDVMSMAQGIAGSGIKQMAYTLVPESRIWAVTDDGDALVFLLDSVNQVYAWSKLTFDGDAESVAVMPTTGEDRVYFLVERTIDSSTVRHIEYLMPEDWGDDQEDAFYVRCGITSDGGTAATVTGITKADPAVITFSAGHGFSNDELIRISSVAGMTEVNDEVYMLKNNAGNTFELNVEAGTSDIDSSGFTAYTSGGTAIQVYSEIAVAHLEGETVDICVDGAVQAQETVDSGAITLTRAGTVVHVGLPYISTAVPMPIPQARNHLKKITEMWIELYETLGLKVGPSASNLDAIHFRGTENMGEALPLHTGNKEIGFDGDYEYDGTVYVVHDQPLPATILSLWYKLGVY